MSSLLRKWCQKKTSTIFAMNSTWRSMRWWHGTSTYPSRPPSHAQPSSALIRGHLALGHENRSPVAASLARTRGFIQCRYVNFKIRTPKGASDRRANAIGRTGGLAKTVERQRSFKRTRPEVFRKQFVALVETLRRGCSVLEAENENLSIDLSDDGGGLEDSKKDDAETHDSGLPIFTLTHDGEQFIVSANPEEQTAEVYTPKMAPQVGPMYYHFDEQTGFWCSLTDGHNLLELLAREILDRRCIGYPKF